MKTLWFKQCYVRPILDGIKQETIRSAKRPGPMIGAHITVSVGPRTPFALIEVVDNEVIMLADLDPEDAFATIALIGDGERMRRIRFRLIRVFEECPEVELARRHH